MRARRSTTGGSGLPPPHDGPLPIRQGVAQAVKLLAGALVLAVFLAAQALGAGVFLLLFPLVSALGEEVQIPVVAVIGCLSVACAVFFVIWAMRQIPRFLNYFRRP